MSTFKLSNIPLDTMVWFLDHSFLENMYWMFKKVNSTFRYLIVIFFCIIIVTANLRLYLFLYCVIKAREDVVGFYSSGPKIKENDLKVP